jgi:hypothetical protein
MISHRHNSFGSARVPRAVFGVSPNTIGARASERAARASYVLSSVGVPPAQGLLPRPTTKERGEGRGEGKISGLYPRFSPTAGRAGLIGARASERAAGQRPTARRSHYRSGARTVSVRSGNPDGDALELNLPFPGLGRTHVIGARASERAAGQKPTARRSRNQNAGTAPQSHRDTEIKGSGIPPCLRVSVVHFLEEDSAQPAAVVQPPLPR